MFSKLYINFINDVTQIIFLKFNWLIGKENYNYLEEKKILKLTSDSYLMLYTAGVNDICAMSTKMSTDLIDPHS